MLYKMTLSDKELVILRARVDENLYHFLLPLLRCDDIAWDESSKQLTLSGELFATCKWHHGIFQSTVAKKFQRNGSVIFVDDLSYTLRINRHNKVIFDFTCGYSYHEWLSLNLHRNMKRRATYMDRQRYVYEVYVYAECHIMVVS